MAVLMLCQTLGAMDSKVLFILVEALKRDLGLSDTQIGLITGPAFSLTYAISAIPISKLSDRGVRVNVIGGAIVFWSALTALGGFALGMKTLLLSRIGVAVGESALTPAAHSIIADYTDKATRPKAIATYSLGLAVGTFLALSLGGFLNDQFGWRTTLFIIGATGILLCVLVLTTVREPAREQATGARELPKGDIRSLLRNKPIRNLMLGGAVLGLSSGALGAWAPAYVMRTFDLSATATGASFGAVAGGTAILGILGGGFIGGWLAHRGPRSAYNVLALAFIVAMLAQIGSLLTSNYPLFIVLTALSIFLVAFYLAPTYSTIQSAVDPSARSFAAAVTMFSISGVGMASGAFVCGLFSDLLQPYYGDDSLRAALIILSFFKLWGAVHYILVGRHLADVEVPEAAPAG
ncbi:MFS transporter [Rhizorhabdus dicambivorans]|nr:MFS transporter [Rhizorhabdus dicambivorans]